MYMIQKEQKKDVEMGESKSQASLIAESLRLLAHVAACQGDDVVARTLYEESLTLARELDYKWYIASCLEELASVVSVQGQPACAARLWDLAEFLRDSVGMSPPPVERAACDRLVGSIAAVPAHFEERDFAAARAERRTLLPEQAITAQGPGPMPMPGQTGSPSIPPAKTSPTYPPGLTAREVEVLHLVAMGLTDAQVAQQLVISPRTVNWHLTSIYSKIGVSSRCAAPLRYRTPIGITRQKFFC
jgi:ATP/maltotriose-dependent transcriptional regulator MalT